MAVSDIPVHVFVMCILSPQAMQLKILLLLVIGFLQVLQDFSDAWETLAFLGLSSEPILLKIFSELTHQGIKPQEKTSP